MTPNISSLAKNYPQQAQAILTLFRSQTAADQLKDLLGSCTCNSPELLGCTCPPTYSAPKLLDYSGFTPEDVSGLEEYGKA